MGTYINLEKVWAAQLEAFPEHSKFLERRLAGLNERALQLLDGLASDVMKLTGTSLRTFAEDYAWLCQQQLDEELFFRRHKRYRLTTFAEAFDAVYSNKPYMTRYMNGLLMTQLWWANHTAVIDFYRNGFLPGNSAGFRHLEIGPGHGLFLYYAAVEKKAGSITGWDISEASVALTQEAMRKLDVAVMPELELQDFFKASHRSFDSIVFSEVLEHMEDPASALDVIRPLLSDNGRLFLNMPINSPAPDHLFNVDTPDDLRRFVENAGFHIEQAKSFPGTNQSLEMSLKKKMTISCVFIARRA